MSDEQYKKKLVEFFHNNGYIVCARRERVVGDVIKSFTRVGGGTIELYGQVVDILPTNAQLIEQQKFCGSWTGDQIKSFACVKVVLD